MIFRAILISALSFIGLSGAAKQINPITQAMLDGYEALLEQNPNDYLTLYERAAQYYRLDDYDKALSDIKKAIEFTPVKDKEQLASEYSLLSDIYTQMEMYPEALSSVQQALTYTPSSYSLLYMKGNTCLRLGQADNAAEAFTAMQRINSRSSESIFGLARVAAMQNNKDKAISLLQDAEKISPGNYLTYCRMGDVYRELGMYQQAAANYLNAFSLTSDSDRPFSSIMDIAKENYDAIDEAIDYAVTRTSNVVPLYFIQGNAALEAGRYDDAYNSYRQLLASLPEEDMVTLYPSLSYICLHKGALSEADDYASKAIMLNSNEKNNILKAKIESARGNYEAALLYAKPALQLNPLSAEALLTAAEIAYNLRDYNASVEYLNEVILNDASDVDALLFRGYLNSEKLDNKAAGLSDYNRVSSLPGSTDEILTKRAIAQVKAGRTLDASSTIAPVYAKADKDAGAAYLSALYYIAVNNKDEAKRLLDNAEALGFNDQYLLQFTNVPLISISPLR